MCETIPDSIQATHRVFQLVWGLRLSRSFRFSSSAFALFSCTRWGRGSHWQRHLPSPLQCNRSYVAVELFQRQAWYLPEIKKATFHREAGTDVGASRVQHTSGAPSSECAYVDCFEYQEPRAMWEQRSPADTNYRINHPPAEEKRW